MSRKPIVAGQFYEDSFNKLNRQIEACFRHRLGPGELPGKRQSRQLNGAISPHAGYLFSGACAAWAYKEIAESTMADSYIILGNSHAGHPSCISKEDWETPLGIVKNDNELAEQIIKGTGLKVNERAHTGEHSIEVQLPFLQFACRDNLQKLRIVPIIIGHDYRKAGAGIRKAITESGKRIAIIASSDFTHYGASYSYLPFHNNVKENMYKLDKGAISWILKHNAYRLTDYAQNTGATICGIMPIAALLESISAERAQLLQYYTSGDITGDYSSAVGYGSLIFTSHKL